MYSFTRLHRFCVLFTATAILSSAPGLFGQSVPAFSQASSFSGTVCPTTGTSDTGSRISISSAIPAGISITATAVSPTAPTLTRTPAPTPARGMSNSRGIFSAYRRPRIASMAERITPLMARPPRAAPREATVISNPDPFVGGELTVTVDNLGKQVDDYLAANTVDPAALYIVWGGGNDLFDDDSAANVTATAERMAGLVEQLARAGAVYILTPNVPPLGLVPNYKDDATKAIALECRLGRLSRPTQRPARCCGRDFGRGIDHDYALSPGHLRALLPPGGKPGGLRLRQHQRQFPRQQQCRSG